MLRRRGPRLSAEQVLRSRPVRNEGLKSERIEGGGVRLLLERRREWWAKILAVIFPIPKVKPVELDAVGEEVWDLCDGQHTLRQMIDTFRERHKLTRAEAEWSLRTYLRDLGKRGLVAEGGRQGLGGQRMATVGQGVPSGRIQVESQIVLPWSRTLQMTRENIFVRFGRSVITASGIFLGIAFMSATLFHSAAEEVQRQVVTTQWGVMAGENPEMRARTIWLVVMSLLVATVGIVNSMLMSVTERYKEIGTMKCLGALDRFIVRLFILEAGILGVLGSLVGAVVGTGAMTLVIAYRIGWAKALSSWTETALVLGGWSVPLWVGMIIGIGVGGLLSVCAALYPAWRAAKMPPAAALRSEF